MHRPSPPGFTLVEILAGLAVLSLLLVLLLSTLNQTSAAVRHTSAQVDAFQQTRTAFDIMTRSLAQATLNPYWDYYNSAGERRTPASASTFIPAKYDRASDLHFAVESNQTLGQGVFFAAPLAYSSDPQKIQTEGLLNACGYFVEFGDSNLYQPSLLGTKPRFRYRLMQSLQTTESFQCFAGTNGSWISTVKDQKWPIATNVIALVIQPRRSIAEDAAGTEISTNYTYDSRGGPAVQRAQLPPVLQITLIVIDKASADRLEAGETEPQVIKDALTGKFETPTTFAQDLQSVEAALRQARIDYRVFTTAVPLRESKWSSS